MKLKIMKFNSGGLIELFTKISTHKNNPLYGISYHAFQNCMALFAQCVHWFHLCCLRTRKKLEWGWYRLYSWVTVFTREKHKQESSGVIDILSIYYITYHCLTEYREKVAIFSLVPRPSPPTGSMQFLITYAKTEGKGLGDFVVCMVMWHKFT